MQVLDIDINGIDTITHEISQIVIQGEILTIHYKNGNVTYWKNIT